MFVAYMVAKSIAKAFKPSARARKPRVIKASGSKSKSTATAKAAAVVVFTALVVVFMVLIYHFLTTGSI